MFITIQYGYDHIYEDPHIEDRSFILHYGDMTDSLNLHVSFRKLIVSIQYVLLRLSEKEYTEKIVGMIGDSVVAVDEKYFRLTEVDLLLGNPSKAQTELNWKPEYDIWAWWPI